MYKVHCKLGKIVEHKMEGHMLVFGFHEINTYPMRASLGLYKTHISIQFHKSSRIIPLETC
jgi:hypothetical protein